MADDDYGLHYKRAIPAGKKCCGSVPNVYCIRWSNEPNMLDAYRAFASGSSHGIRVYQDVMLNWMLLYNKFDKQTRYGLSVEWNPVNARMLATGSGCGDEGPKIGGLLRLLEYKTTDRKFHTKKVFGPMDDDRVVGSISFSADGHYLVAALYSCVYAIYSCDAHMDQGVERCILGVNLSTNRYVQTVLSYPNGGQKKFEVKFHPKRNDIFLSAAVDDPNVWVISCVEVGGGIHGLCFNWTGTYLITIQKQQLIRIWRFNSDSNPILLCKHVSHQLPHEYPDGLLSCSWVNAKYLVVGGNSKLCIYKTGRSGDRLSHVHTRRSYTHVSRVFCVEWTHDSIFASGGSDGFTILWKLLSPNEYPPYGDPQRFYLREQRYYDIDYEVPGTPDSDLPSSGPVEDTRSIGTIPSCPETSKASFDYVDPTTAFQDLTMEEAEVEETEVDVKLKAVRSIAVSMLDHLRAGAVPTTGELMSSYEAIILLCNGHDIAGTSGTSGGG